MIVTDSGLAELVDRIRRAASFGIDLEFQRERTYYAKLCLIQIAVPVDTDREDLALVDPFEVKNLEPLWTLVADPEIEKTLHAGDQDMEIVYQEGRVVPRRIFDTQIGAALIGYGDQPGYATLVDRVLSVRLSKLETVTDWARRPLTPGQIEYALDDVHYLYPVRRHIENRLAETGRTEWAREEMSHYEERENYERDPARLYLKLPRTRSMNRRSLAVLQELAVWREREAVRRDLPRGRVVADEILTEIAKRVPRRKSDLSILRGLHPREIERSGDGIIESVERAVARPESDWPEIPEIRNEDPDIALAVDLMEVLLRARARENGIAPSYLGNRRDITRLFETVREGGAASPGVNLMSGWRRELIGNELIDLVRGRTNLHLDPGTGRLDTSSR